ncbi:MAG: right-handed parallel beta-helix repeat-containing protein [Planctomycetes bacterium]|nr:right-handed parallel beta-helix repeat-containing protein [Planctomycetota bacterium]
MTTPVITLAILASCLFPAATWTVDPDGTGGFADIQSALDAAASGDGILVSAGEYVVPAPLDFGGRAVRLLAPEGPAATTIRLADPPADPARTSVVIFERGEGDGTILEGFTLTGGRGTVTGLSGSWAYGGNVLCRNGSSPRIVLCRIAGGRIEHGWGGGIACIEASSPMLLDCSIEDNAAYERGGGVYCEGLSSPAFERCRIARNVVDGRGGGFHASSGSLRVISCTIERNLARRHGGGGIGCDDGASLVLRSSRIAENAEGGISCFGLSAEITDCVIARNSARSSGGISCAVGTIVRCKILENAAERGSGGGCSVGAGGPIRIEGCEIRGNFASESGGGLHVQGHAEPEVVNCVIAGNAAGRQGGAIYSTNSFVHLTNSTVAMNEGGLTWSAGPPTLRNTILWGNDPNWLAADAEVIHGLTDRDPLFVRDGSFDFGRFITLVIGGEDHRVPNFILVEPDLYLRPDSPALDAGTPEGAPAADVHGVPRPCGGGVDIGAFEYCGRRFIRGDGNGDARLNIADAAAVLQHMFVAIPIPCASSGDVNDDGRLDLADPIVLLEYLFREGSAPRPPFPGCDPDPTVDDLPCDAHPACPGG